MKFHYISDLHLDFYNVPMDQFLVDIRADGSADAIIIAGDLGHHNHQSIDLLTQLSTRYPNVLFTIGNHDMYAAPFETSTQRVQQLRDFSSSISNLHFLDGTSVVIDSITIAGTCMSWDTSFYKQLTKGSVNLSFINTLYHSYMADSRRIITTPTWNPYKFFASEYNKLAAIPQADIIVSHYAPVIPPGIPSRFAKSPSSTFFYFDGLDQIQRLQPSHWIFGHTHTPYNFTAHGTNFLCNPLGYPGESTIAEIAINYI